jgi:hypothetical protein
MPSTNRTKTRRFRAAIKKKQRKRRERTSGQKRCKGGKRSPCRKK